MSDRNNHLDVKTCDGIMFFTGNIGIGGVERVFVTYANALADHGRVYYAYCNENGEFMNSLDPRVNRVQLGAKRIRYAIFYLVKAINRYKPEYLITGGDYPNVFCVVASWLSHVHPKVIISQHNYYNVEVNRLVLNSFFKLFYNRANRIVAVSKGISSFMEEHGVESAKISIIYNPVKVHEVVRLSSHEVSIPHKRYIVYVGRISPVKNLSFLIRSFQLLAEKHPDLVLMMIGDGVEMSSLKEEVGRIKMEDRIVLMGAVENPYPFMANSQLVVLPSLSEALPTVILEAFCLGKTVVATPTKGAVDLLADGKYGYLATAYDDVEEFCRLMDDALAHPFNEVLLVQQSKQYDIKRKVEELSDVLNKA